MKKTFNINVAGFAFTIDDDAYGLLSNYLDTIEHAFCHQDDSHEIISDIESRIAELLLECTSSGSSIVSASDVENVIARVGKPEEMLEDDIKQDFDSSNESFSGSHQFNESVTPPPYVPPTPKMKKKLFRDPQNTMVAGVCSGLAYYFNTDPTAVRLLTVLLTIISVSTMGIAYVILWLVVPEARTPYERMQMMGEQATVENIGRTVTDNFREENSSGQQTANVSQPAGFGQFLATFFGVCTKILIIIGLIIAIPILVGLAIALIGCVFALIMFGTSWGATFFGDTYPSWLSYSDNIPVWGVACAIGSILTIGIPLFLLIRMGIKKNNAPIAKNVRNVLIIIWALGFILAGISTGRIINISDKLERQQSERWQNERAEWEDETLENLSLPADSADSVSSIPVETAASVEQLPDSLSININK